MSNTSEAETETVTLCANCGKGEDSSINLKACAACKLVKYCSRDCQIAHRPQHKKECKKRAKELHDEKLFELPPPLEDCPICFLRMPYLGTGRIYMACCGKMICGGCIHAPVHDHEGNVIREKTCPFCRIPVPTSDEEYIKRVQQRIELNDSEAIYNMGCYYALERHGLPQNHAKALELWHRAGESGFADAYYSIGHAYYAGRDVEVDEKKAIHYYELAAMGGDSMARHNLGVIESEVGNYDRALKHWIISTKDGDSDSLDYIKMLYKKGHATKDDFANALRSYQAFLDEIKSDQRDKAAAYKDEYKYYGST